jgi:uncharacterized protein YdiU (UPF0061 family)
MAALIQFDNTYQRDLEGFYVPWHGKSWPAPKTIKVNHVLAKELGLDFTALDEAATAALFSGSEIPLGASPLTQVYAGHQFGSFNPQLGDGRALLLGEVVDSNGIRRDIQLKGSGKTPFSRGGDGKAALGPVLREYIISEAMHALGVPTTRALAAVTTGQNVLRESSLPGAVLTRVATSHLRVGTFQYFAARGENDKVKQLADYAIARHYPVLVNKEERYLRFLESVCHAQSALVAKWMSLGFIHGVMNTDNTTISGETIDYGPCAFMEDYDPATVFSSIDAQGRYQYQNQPSIAIWNLSRLADTLLPLLDDVEERGIEKASSVLNSFSETYFTNWTIEMRKKLGLSLEKSEDTELANALFKIMDGQSVDFTKFFHSLSDSLSGEDQNTKQLFKEPNSIDAWLAQWKVRLAEEPDTEKSSSMMKRTNPIYIPRNHKVEEALNSATHEQNFSLFEKLVDVLSTPYDKRNGLIDYESTAPDTFGPYQTFCGT